MKKKVDLNTLFARQVIEAAAAGCELIAPGTVRNARQICGTDFWQALATREKIDAGSIILAAVNAGRLPQFITLKPSTSNHQRYKRI